MELKTGNHPFAHDSQGKRSINVIVKHPTPFMLVYGLLCLPGKVALKKHVDEYVHFTYSYQKLLVFQDTNPSNAAGWYP